MRAAHRGFYHSLSLTVKELGRVSAQVLATGHAVGIQSKQNRLGDSYCLLERISPRTI